jgi:hypothetical protein
MFPKAGRIKIQAITPSSLFPTLLATRNRQTFLSDQSTKLLHRNKISELRRDKAMLDAARTTIFLQASLGKA